MVEIAVHAAELPHWVGYIAFAFALYAEVNLMILMWRFRKTGSGKLCKEAENNTGCAGLSAGCPKTPFSAAFFS